MIKRENLLTYFYLHPHPEGGFYAETYRSAATRPDGRACTTSILFLLTAEYFSALHRLDAEEVWFWQGGAALTVHVIGEDGQYQAHRVGPDARAGEVLQLVVPAGVWFGSSVEADAVVHSPLNVDALVGAGAVPDGVPYALVGCVVSPGFSFDGFELAKRDALLARHSEHAGIITRLTRV